MLITIFTCNREDMCGETIKAHEEYRTHVVEEGFGHYKYGGLVSVTCTDKMPSRETFYKNWNIALQYAKQSNNQYFLFLPDDFTPAVPRPAARAKELLAMSGADVLVPIVDGRGRGPCWVAVDPVNHGATWETGWVDGCFITTRHVLDALDWRVPDIPPEHFTTNQSSGVGKYMSLALHRLGFRVHQVDRTLYYHGKHDSVMHYEHRKDNPL